MIYKTAVVSTADFTHERYGDTKDEFYYIRK